MAAIRADGGVRVFPIGDDDKPGQGLAWVTVALLLINIGVFFLVQLPDEEFTYGYAVVPVQIVENRDITEPTSVRMDGREVVIPHAPGPDPIHLTLITSLFMHGGLLHLAGNMLFLGIFGDNIEHRFGRIRYLLFYIGAGVLATLAHIAVDPGSLIPTLGASGAISGILGAYIVLYPRNRVTMIVFRFIPIRVAAFWAIGIWAVLQFVYGLGQIAVTQQTAGVAYMAHIGGFIVGLVVGFTARGSGGSRGSRRRRA
jgi:membrane associated rhomboid family serine protease